MQDISAVVDSTNGVSASEFKQICGEEENFITSAGIALNQSDTTQIGKAAAVYAGGADAYEDISTSANLIRLSPIGNKKYPPAYFYGMRVRFKPAFSNTITQPDIRLPSMSLIPLGAKTVTSPTVPSLAVGFLDTSKWYTAVYTTTGTVDYFRLENVVESYDLTAGVIEEENIAALAVTEEKIGAGAVTNDKVASDILLSKINGTASSQNVLDIASPGGEKRIRLNEERVLLGTDDVPNCQVSRLGILFAGTGNPGGLTISFRWAIMEISSKLGLVGTAVQDTWTGNRDTDPYGGGTVDPHVHKTGTTYVLEDAQRLNTEIPWTALTFGAIISYTNNDGKKVDGAPVRLLSDNVGGIRYVKTIILDNTDYTYDSEMDTSEAVILTVFFQSSSL